MSVQVQLFRDEYGYPRAEAAAPYQILGWFLEQDIQADSEWARELIKIIEEIQSGTESRWEGTGNVHTLILTPEKAYIESEFAEPQATCEISLDDLKQAVADWLAFLEQSPDQAPGKG